MVFWAVSNLCLLPPANEVCEGYVFTGVCPQGWACVSHDQPRMPPRNHACPPGNHTPPGNHACPPWQPRTPPRNHARRGGMHVTWPTTHAPWQPCTPPATTHTPPQPRMPPGNHACPLATMHAPPLATTQPPRQPCMPPLATTHAPLATTHAPPATMQAPPSQSRYRKSTFFTSFFEYLYRLMSKTCSKNHIKFIYGHIS